MTLEEFVERYNGKKVDFDRAYGAQCVDLFRQYNMEVLAQPHTGAVEGAKDLFLRYDNLSMEKECFERISEKNGKGRKGDVVVWNATKTNPFGHVAIFLSYFGDNSCIVFEQDGFKQDGAKVSLRKTENLLGFLRKK